MSAVNKATFLLGALLVLLPGLPEAAEPNPAQLERIAKLIFQNECGSREACLTSWNKGEEFASLGIGHFIWYPEGTTEKEKHFSESFPKLIRSMRQQGVAVPAWLNEDTGSPWLDREAFEKAKKT